MAPPISEFSRQLQALELEIKKLEIEYQNFSLGRTPKLPWETRSRIENTIKQYDRMQIQNTAERFRFQGLQMKFSTFCERWERDLKLRELGRPGPQRARAGDGPPPAASLRSSTGSALGASSAAANGAAGGGSTRPDTVSIRNPEAELDTVRALHHQVNAARRRAGEADVPFERFQDVVRAQVSKLGRDGGAVTFRVGEKDGRVTFTAKVSKDAGEEEE